jgi:hypothetical protein
MKLHFLFFCCYVIFSLLVIRTAGAGERRFGGADFLMRCGSKELFPLPGNAVLPVC